MLPNSSKWYCQGYTALYDVIIYVCMYNYRHACYETDMCIGTSYVLGMAGPTCGKCSCIHMDWMFAHTQCLDSNLITAFFLPILDLNSYTDV